MKKIIFSIALLLIATLVMAQNSTASTDEQQIRSIIAQENNGNFSAPATEDNIFVSGPFPRPIIGKKDAVSQQISDSLSKARKNYSFKKEVVRLVVAQSGDIAYEFGNGIIRYDDVNNKNVTLNNSYVRTWKKVNGQWQVDITFARPNRL